MSFRERLIGAWELLSCQLVAVDDEKDIVYPMGEDCRGTIMYTPDGYMASALQDSSVRTWSGTLTGTDAEQLDTIKKFMGYSGPFYLEPSADDENKATLYHSMITSIPPNWIGNTQARPGIMKEEDGELIMYLTARLDDDRTSNSKASRVPKVKWRKMKDNSKAAKPSKIDF